MEILDTVFFRLNIFDVVFAIITSMEQGLSRNLEASMFVDICSQPSLAVRLQTCTLLLASPHVLHVYPYSQPVRVAGLQSDKQTTQLIGNYILKMTVTCVQCFWIEPRI